MVRYIDLVSDTICSPVTAQGHAGVAVVRISGDKALEVSQKFIHLKKWKSHQSRLASILNSKGEMIDQALVTYFEKDKSFTGDETVEIACHGNPLIVNQVVELYLKNNCRLAERGEFSFRAFFNGKIDLVQAESIQSLVMSKNQWGSKTFLQQLQGGLSSQIDEINDGLILALSHLEASIDFSEEDIEPKEREHLQSILIHLKQTCDELIKTYDLGKTIHQAQKIVILGQTNVGKSSLFNAILKQDRSIVTDIEGTTRDLVSARKFIENLEFEFVDSAGLRESSDLVESLGIQKSYEQAKEADLILYVFDSVRRLDDNIEFLPLDKTFFVFNKEDLRDKKQSRESLIQKLQEKKPDIKLTQVFFVSSLHKDGIGLLLEEINKHFSLKNSFDETFVVTQARHFAHLKKASKHLEVSMELLSQLESPDLISQELSLALSEILQIMGKEYNDEVLDKIFQEFCLGK